MLAGLGGKPDDPVRPGCSGLFKSFFGCNTWIKFPPLGIFRINSDGVPVPQDKPSDPGEPGDPGTDENPNDPENENNTAQPTVRTHEKTDSHDSSMSSQSNPKTRTSAGSSTFKSITQTKSSAWHSSPETVASTRSKQRTLKTASRSTLSRSSTASTASATATSTSYIIQLKPAISATQLEDITNDVKAHTTSTYTISLGSRPNDTVICAKLNPSSFAQFNADSRVSSHRLLISRLVFPFKYQINFPSLQVSAVLVDQKVVLEQDPTTSQAASSGSSSAARSRLSKRLIENDGDYSFQSDPFVPELNFISQPPGTSLAQMANYKFPATAGQAVDVYVPDSGCNVANAEFVNMIGSYRWLRPPAAAWPGPELWAPVDPNGHGTCMADKVAGYNYGVAKNANLIFLRLPDTDNDDDDVEIFISGMLLVFQMMADDIVARKSQGYTKLPVVSISWGVGVEDVSEEFQTLLLRAISNLMSRGTVLIMASGRADEVSYPNILSCSLVRF